MPGLSEERMAELTEMLLEFLDAADLEDAEADEVCAVLLPRLQANSGWNCYAFRNLAAATLPPDVYAKLKREQGGYISEMDGQDAKAALIGVEQSRGGIAMLKPSQERIAGLIEMLLELLDTADLDDDAADEV